jgi:ketosteroid isomerase-like protein
MKQILFIATAIILFSCNDTADKQLKEAKFEIEPVKKHIFEKNKTYSSRFTTGDSLYYVEHYCADAEVMSPNVPIVKGREAIRKFFYNDGQNNEAIIELPDGNIYGDEDLVVEEGVYNFPDGKGGSVDKGKFIALWKQEDGKWKLYREIWNTDLPPAPSK